jgi:hypothetical protein
MVTAVRFFLGAPALPVQAERDARAVPGALEGIGF